VVPKSRAEFVLPFYCPKKEAPHAWKLKSIMNGTYTQGSIACLMGGLVRGLVTWNGDGREMVSDEWSKRGGERH
jgi:hypothetical protein